MGVEGHVLRTNNVGRQAFGQEQGLAGGELTPDLWSSWALGDFQIVATRRENELRNQFGVMVSAKRPINLPLLCRCPVKRSLFVTIGAIIVAPFQPLRFSPVPPLLLLPRCSKRYCRMVDRYSLFRSC